MTNISSYKNQKGQYVYQREASASGASGGYWASGASGAYWASGASGVYSASGASGVTTKQNISLGDISPSDIVEMFISGNLTKDELLKWLKTSKYKSMISDIQVKSTNNLHTINFKFQNKQYSISCTKDAADSQTDKKTQEVLTLNDLKNKSFSEKDIAKYFIQVSNMGTAKYALKPDCGYKTIKELENARQKEFKEAQNNLIMQNFLAGNVTYTSGGREYESSIALKKTSDGKTITISNYANYADEIKKATGNDVNELKRNALNKFKQDFASGNVAFAQASTILNAIGVEHYKSKLRNGNYVLTFDFEGEHYSITCNKEAAASGVDNIMSYEGLCKAYWQGQNSKTSQVLTLYMSTGSVDYYRENSDELTRENLESLKFELLNIIYASDGESNVNVFYEALRQVNSFLYTVDSMSILNELGNCGDEKTITPGAGPLKWDETLHAYLYPGKNNRIYSSDETITLYRKSPTGIITYLQSKINPSDNTDEEITEDMYEGCKAEISRYYAEFQQTLMDLCLSDEARKYTDEYGNYSLEIGDIADAMCRDIENQIKQLDSSRYRAEINSLKSKLDKLKPFRNYNCEASRYIVAQYEMKHNPTNILENLVNDISAIFKSGSVTDNEFAILQTFANYFVSSAGRMSDAEKKAFLNVMTQKLQSFELNENYEIENIDANGAKEARFYLSLIMSVSDEFAIADKDLSNMAKIKKILDIADKGTEITNDDRQAMKTILSFEDFNDLRGDLADFNNMIVNDISEDDDVNEVIDTIYLQLPNVKTYSELDDRIKEIITPLCEYDGSYNAIMNISNIVEYVSSIMNSLEKHGYTQDDIYGSDGLIANGSFTMILTGALMYGSYTLATEEIDSLLATAKNKKSPIGSSTELSNYIKERAKQGLDSIFSTLDIFTEGYYDVDLIAEQYKETLVQNSTQLINIIQDENFLGFMEEKLDEKLRSTDKEFNFATFNECFAILFEDYIKENSSKYKMTEEEKFVMSQYLSNIMYTSIMAGALGIENFDCTNEASVQKAQDAIDKYFSDNYGATYNQIFPQASSSKGRNGAKAQSSNIFNKIGGFVSDQFNKLLANITDNPLGVLKSVFVAGISLIAGPWGVLAANALSEIYISGCKDEYGNAHFGQWNANTAMSNWGHTLTTILSKTPVIPALSVSFGDTQISIKASKINDSFWKLYERATKDGIDVIWNKTLEKMNTAFTSWNMKANIEKYFPEIDSVMLNYVNLYQNGMVSLADLEKYFPNYKDIKTIEKLVKYIDITYSGATLYSLQAQDVYDKIVKKYGLSSEKEKEILAKMLGLYISIADQYGLNQEKLNNIDLSTAEGLKEFNAMCDEKNVSQEDREKLKEEMRKPLEEREKMTNLRSKIDALIKGNDLSEEDKRLLTFMTMLPDEELTKYVDNDGKLVAETTQTLSALAIAFGGDYFMAQKVLKSIGSCSPEISNTIVQWIVEGKLKVAYNNNGTTILTSDLEQYWYEEAWNSDEAVMERDLEYALLMANYAIADESLLGALDEWDKPEVAAWQISHGSGDLGFDSLMQDISPYERAAADMAYWGW